MTPLATHIILLRGVNVGRAKRVPMAKFKLVLEALGCTSVATLLNSGNAVLRCENTLATDLAAQVAQALKARFGFEVPVVVKSAEFLDAVVAANALASGADDHSRLLVVFAQEASVLKSLHWLSDMVEAPEAFLLTKEAGYLHCPDGILQSRTAVALLGQSGQAVTTRNWATVLKIQALARKLQDGA